MAAQGRRATAFERIIAGSWARKLLHRFARRPISRAASSRKQTALAPDPTAPLLLQVRHQLSFADRGQPLVLVESTRASKGFLSVL